MGAKVRILMRRIQHRALQWVSIVGGVGTCAAVLDVSIPTPVTGIYCKGAAQ